MSSTTSSTRAVAEVLPTPPSHANRIIGLASQLFALQDERAACSKRSKELNEQMNKIKKTCARWMQNEEQDELESVSHGRKIVKTTRKIKKKAKVDDLLDWIEQDNGVSERRRMEQRIKQYESQVVESRQEYRITYSGVRRKNQRVAPDNGTVKRSLTR